MQPLIKWEKKLSNLIEPRKGISKINRYKGGKGSSLEGVIKLSSNESALGPSKSAVSAFNKASSSLSIYPDGNSTILKNKLSELYDIESSNIICGAGSDEILNLIASAYLRPGDEVIYSEHAFLLYKIITLANDAIPVPAKEIGLKTNIKNIISAVTNKTKIVFIANPNNPTGSYLTRDELLTLRDGLPEEVLLVIDGAYAEYVQEDDYTDGMDMIANNVNTVMTRTFSKVYGLAALRIGWAYCPMHIIEVLNKIRGPFNLSTASILAGTAALSDQEHVVRSVQFNIEEKKILVEKYKELGIDVIDGVANFILLNFSSISDIEYENLRDFLISKKVYLRDVADYGLPQHLRLSIGSKENNRVAFDKIAEFFEKKSNG